MPNPVRALVRLAVCALCLAAFIAAAHAAARAPRAHARAARSEPRAARELLLDPGFEQTLPGHDWMPVGWDTSQAGLPTVFFGRDSFLVHSGRFGVNIANTSTLYPMAHNWSQTVLVGPSAWNHTAVFSAWTRANGLDGRAYVMLQAYRDTVTRMARIWGVDRDEALRRMGINKVDDPALDLGWKREQFSASQTDWVRREVRVFVPPRTNVLFARMGLFGTGQVAFDDASLRLEPPDPAPAYAPGANLLADPDFEQGGDAWEIVVPPYQGARIDVDSTVAHSGRHSARLSNFHDGLVQTRMGVCQPFSGRGLAGRRVRAAAWFKGDSLHTTAFVKIYAHSRSRGVVQSPGAELLSGTFDWKRLAIDLPVPADTDELWVWFLADAPATGTLWIDDASFEIVPPAGGAADAASH